MLHLYVDARRCIVILRQRGYSVSQIRARMLEENVVISCVSIYKLLKRHKETRTVIDRRRESATKFLSSEHLRFINNTMAHDNELTA